MITSRICSVPLLILIFYHVSGKEYEFFHRINFNAMREDPKMLERYFECLINNKDCTPDYEEVRMKLPEMFANCCEFCPRHHQEGLLVMREHLMKTKPDFLLGLLNKYDPDGKHTAHCLEKFEKQLLAQSKE